MSAKRERCTLQRDGTSDVGSSGGGGALDVRLRIHLCSYEDSTRKYLVELLPDKLLNALNVGQAITFRLDPMRTRTPR